MNHPVYPCGDCAVSIQIGNAISEAVNREVVSVLTQLQKACIPGVCELVPSYTCICVHYDPAIISYDRLLERLSDLDAAPDNLQTSEGPVVEIPVCYGGEYGPDLAYVASYHQITEEEVKKQALLSVEEYELVSENNNEVRFKFKIVEMFQNIGIKLAQS